MDFIKIVDALIAALYFCGAVVHVAGAVAGRKKALRAGAATRPRNEAESRHQRRKKMSSRLQASRLK